MKKAVVLVEKCMKCPGTHNYQTEKQNTFCSYISKWVNPDTLDSECPLEDVKEPAISGIHFPPKEK